MESSLKALRIGGRAVSWSRLPDAAAAIDGETIVRRFVLSIHGYAQLRAEDLVAHQFLETAAKRILFSD